MVKTKGIPNCFRNPIHSSGLNPYDKRKSDLISTRFKSAFLSARIFLVLTEKSRIGTQITGLNVVHVKDVARGHLLAARSGKVGEKYILANRNMLLQEFP